MKSTRLLPLLAALLLGGALPPLAAEDLSADFLKALRQFQSDRPESRKAGEMFLRKLGAKAIPQIKMVLAQSDRQAERLRQLLADLEGHAVAAPDAGSAELLQRYFIARLEEGWTLLLKGDHASGRRIAEALETLDKDSLLLFDYRRLKRECEKHSLVKDVLEPSVDFQARVYEAGDSPVVHFRLTNHQREQVVIHAQKGILGELEVTIIKSHLKGQTLREVRKFPIRTILDKEDLVLPAGISHEKNIHIPLGDEITAGVVVVQLRAVGKFRPSQWGVGDKNISETLDLPPAECWLVPKGELNLAQSPLRKLEVSIFFKKIDTFFTAGQLAVWAADEDPLLKERLTGLLVSNLNGLDDFGYEIANRFLQDLSGVARSRPTDRLFWREWWARQRTPEPSGED